jgi:FkbM family methyltransferase
MSLDQLRDSHHRGEIKKLDYLEKMRQEHAHLADYAAFIKRSALSSITITDDCVVFTTREHGVKLECDPCDMGIPPIVALNFGSYESSDGKMMLSLVEDGMNFFDIGANLGWYALHVAKLFPNAKVFAFEPVKKTFGYLTRNISHNELDNMSSFHFGLSNENTIWTFYVNPAIMGAASGSPLASSAGEPQNCEVRTLDNFIDGNPLIVDFIKADVEGAELLVIKGGLETIKASKPILFLEMLRKHSKMFNYHPNDIIELLRGIGYHCYIIQRDKLVEFFSMDEETVETNFIFLHSEKHKEKIERFTAE